MCVYVRVGSWQCDLANVSHKPPTQLTVRYCEKQTDIINIGRQ